MSTFDPSHRRQWKRYDIPGHAHYLTFSCFQRQAFLTPSDGHPAFSAAWSCNGAGPWHPAETDRFNIVMLSEAKHLAIRIREFNLTLLS